MPALTIGGRGECTKDPDGPIAGHFIREKALTKGAAMNFTRKNLQNIIKEELNAVLSEGSGEMLGWMAKQTQNINQTTIDEAYQMLLEAMRLFYDNNDRLGVVNALADGDEEAAKRALEIRNAIVALADDMVAKMDFSQK